MDDGVAFCPKAIVTRRHAKVLIVKLHSTPSVRSPCASRQAQTAGGSRKQARQSSSGVLQQV